MKKHTTVLAALLVIWIVTSPEVRAREKGLRLGKFRFSPSVKLAAGIDSNPLFTEVAPASDGLLEIRPGFVFKGVSNRLLLETSYDYSRLQYLETDIQNSDNHHARFNLQLKSYRWSLEADNKFDLTSDPADEQILERLERAKNEASAIVSYFSPSKDMEFRLRYTNTVLDFAGDLNALSSFQNQLMISSTVNVSSFFRFLPKTALNSSLQYSHLSFPDVQDPNIRTKGDSFEATLGIVGSLTTKSSILLSLGYNHSGFDVGPSANNFTATAKGRYKWRSTAFELGYERSVTESQFTNFVTINALKYQIEWISHTEKLKFRSDGDLNFINYSGPVTLVSGDERNDTVIRNNLRGAYGLLQWMEIFLEYNYAMRDSNAVDLLSGADSADFKQHTALLGVLVSY